MHGIGRGSDQFHSCDLRQGMQGRRDEGDDSIMATRTELDGADPMCVRDADLSIAPVYTSQS